MRALLLASAGLALAACTGELEGGLDPSVTPIGPTRAAIDVAVVNDPSMTEAPAPLTASEAEHYLHQIAPMVVSRVLTAQERARLESEGAKAVAPILTGWTQEPGFADAARLFIEQGLNTSGVKDGVDYSLPGNLAHVLAKNGRPWKELVTATECYGANDAVKPCDSGAPFKGGGLLNTQGFLKKRAGRFNLTRASTMMRTFACRAYPMEDALQPRPEKTQLMPMFRALTAAEQTDPRAADQGINGHHCYSCHGQFSFHTQLFVKFDSEGHYQAAATGVQDPMGELGRSKNGLMASHFVEPERAGDERSQMFETPVANLAEAGVVLANSPTFVECTAEHFLNHTLGLQWGVVTYDRALMRKVAAKARAVGDPSLGDIVVALFSDPQVMQSIGHKVDAKATP